MKTVVLDDDPTGTQSAHRVQVLFQADAASLARALSGADSVYVQTNSRAIPEAEAIALVRRLRHAFDEACAALGAPGVLVLRGDSTLRGHVFSELDAVSPEDAVVVFAPAFPEGGRTTIGGVHYVDVDGKNVPVANTEFADDPIFSFRSSRLVDFVAERSKRFATSVPLHSVRAGEFGRSVLKAAPRTVLVPDVVNDEDICLVADGIREARAAGREIAVRSAAPLAAELAGVSSRGALVGQVAPSDAATLVVCGSHTAGATAQLKRLSSEGVPIVTLPTARVFENPRKAVGDVVEQLRRELERTGLATVATERSRLAEHGTLAHGERVMSALVAIVEQLLPVVDLVVTKGGITASEVSSRAIGATSAHVVGQLLPGVSVWRQADRAGREVHQVIVPGNVGGPDTIVESLRRARGAVLTDTKERHE